MIHIQRSMANGCMKESILGGAFFGTTYTIDIPEVKKRTEEKFADKLTLCLVMLMN